MPEKAVPAKPAAKKSAVKKPRGRRAGGKPVILMKMFGSYSIQYNGKSVLGTKKSTETQFAYLMQMLIHNGENGVGKELLAEVLFQNRDIEDENHALRTIIYNARHHLDKMGIPDADRCIISRGGIVYWNFASYPVWEDAAEFDRAFAAAEAMEPGAKRTSAYIEAAHLYTGEFLQPQATVRWAVQEKIRYEKMFETCVNTAAEGLRSEGNYMQLEELGRYAAEICPYRDWELLTMEALTNSGRFEEAERFYNETASRYFTEQGTRPSPKMDEAMAQLADKIDHPTGAMETIRESLSKNSDARGGYLCSYPVFRGVYQMVQRMTERTGQSVYLMVCTLTDSKGNAVREDSIKAKTASRMCDVICGSLRQCDAVCQYSKGQCLVILVNTSLENCSIVEKRISKNFVSNRIRTTIQYQVSPI